MALAKRSPFGRLWSSVSRVTRLHRARTRQQALSSLSRATTSAGSRLADARLREQRLRRLSTSFTGKHAIAEWESACRQVESLAGEYEAALDRLLQSSPGSPSWWRISPFLRLPWSAMAR